jgi:hypothetical protein
MKRLLGFSLALFACAACIELFARRLEPKVAAVSNRVEFKAALFDGQPETQLLFIGTSRFNDGISPKIVSEVLNGRGRAWRGFNASTPSSSLEALTHVVKRSRQHPGLMLTVIEVSDRQIARDVGFTISDEGERPEAGIEGTLQHAVATHSAVMRHRRAFVLENVPRWAGLLFAPVFDGSEWFRTNSLFEALRPKTEIPTEPWQPAPLVSGTAGAPSDIVGIYAGIAEQAQNVVFVSPPVAPGHHGCSNEMRALFAAVADRTHKPMWDFACANVPESFFHDGREHLSDVGRVYFSTALAVLIAKEQSALQ